MANLSPLAPDSFPLLPPVGGVRLMTAEAGIRYSGRDDVLLMVFDQATAAAGVFTKSRCPSAPVEWCKRILPSESVRAVLVNSGNANAFTGRRGREATEISAAAVAQAIGCSPDQVLLASTGVIGEPLAADKFASVVGDMARDAKPERWESAAQAIMTTDTFAKGAARTTKIGDTDVRINGIAKGSGMIAPDMATMLGFVVTDAAIAPSVLQALLTHGVSQSFNAVTVDGDTSTSDTVIALATSAAGHDPVTEADDPRLVPFAAALNALLLDLAHQIVRDGEGASKFVEIEITGAESDRSARRIGLSVANSPLVKTAIAGEDANWGRVVMAVGKAGEPADRDRLAIWFGPHQVARDGERDPDYAEEAVSDYMKAQDLKIRVDLGIGEGRTRVWTCDLTHGYIDINADYRT